MRTVKIDENAALVKSSRIERVTLYRHEGSWWKYVIVMPSLILLALDAVCFLLLTNHLLLFIITVVVIVFLFLLLLLCCYWNLKLRLFIMFRKLKKFELPTTRFKELVYAFIEPKLHRGMKALCVLEMKNRYLSRTSNWDSDDSDDSDLDSDNSEEEEEIDENEYILIYFEYQKRKYFFDRETSQFRKPVSTIAKPMKFFQHECKGLQSSKEKEDMELRYGLNKFEIPLPTFVELFKDHALKPFFVFQIFCVMLWMIDEYWYYSLFTMVMLFAFEATVVNQRLRNLKFIRKMRIKPYELKVKRTNENSRRRRKKKKSKKNRRKDWKTIFSDNLLPYDLIQLEENENAPCDILLVTGKCVTDESLLTGESTPQIKDNIIEFENGDEIIDLKKNKFKRHIVFGGTKVLKTIVTEDVHSNTTTAESRGAKNNKCLGIVLRTGFETNQGKLLRTILFSTEQMSVNNIEALVFIGILLIFAIFASVYVLRVGLADPNYSRWNLLLNCILIITSVVPPELPMELSLAVNSSLVALTRLGIFCTEPFRIPEAGKIDICCFDKTGTLTSESMKLNAVSVGTKLYRNDMIPRNAQLILSACHSLLVLDKSVVGDPMEKAGLEGVGFKYERNVSQSIKGNVSVKILKRFAFLSELKRMSVIVDVHGKRKVFVKGAAETLKKLFIEVPEKYDAVFNKLAATGNRVIALGMRDLGTKTRVERIKRVDVEKEFSFQGFAVFESELKEHTKETIIELMNSEHKIVMITGDHPFTATQVAKSLQFLTKSNVASYKNNAWRIDDVALSVDEDEIQRNFDLCVTGDVMMKQDDEWLLKWIPRISVFARTTPVQKELIINTLKKLECGILMCGDGTNDVGALKQADIGIALLDNKKKKKKKEVKGEKQVKKTKNPKNPMELMQDPEFQKLGMWAKWKEMARQSQQLRKNPRKKRGGLGGNLQQMLDSQDNVVTQLGDASIAAPFTSRKSTIQSVLHVISQGRCTLVTTMQMYKILALNCLLTAYSLSVLYLDGVKYGDKQLVISGVIIAACFLFVSRSKPIPTLSKKRPVTSIFATQMVLSMFGQFLINIVVLVLCVHAAKVSVPPTASQLDLDTEYEKSLLNTVVFLIQTLQNVITFLVNYEGRPFMVSMFQNKGLFICLIIISVVIFSIAGNVVPDLNVYMEVSDIDDVTRRFLLLMMVGNVAFVWLYERLVALLFQTKRKDWKDPKIVNRKKYVK